MKLGVEISTFGDTLFSYISPSVHGLNLNL